MIWNSWFNEGKSFGCFDPCWRSLPCFHPCWRSLVLNVFLGPSADPNTTKTMQMFWTFFGRSCEPFLDLRKSAVKFAHARDFCGSRGQTNALATIVVCCGTQCFITDSWFRWVFPAASIPNDLAMPGRSFEKNPLPETKIATEHSWFEDDRFPFGVTHFQGRTISFRECSPMIHYITKKILPLDWGVVSPRTSVKHSLQIPYPRRIHETGIFTFIYHIKLTIHVGKYPVLLLLEEILHHLEWF